MSGSGRLAVGDWVEFDDDRHQVIGFIGAAARLRSEAGHVQIIMVAALLADPTFHPAAAPAAPPPSGSDLVLDVEALLDGVEEAERRRVLDMQAHLPEVTTGYRSGNAGDAAVGEPRMQYQPDRSLEQRITAKAVERWTTHRSATPDDGRPRGSTRRSTEESAARRRPVLWYRARRPAAGAALVGALSRTTS